MKHTVYISFYIYLENNLYVFSEIDMTSRTQKILKLVLKNDDMPPSDAIFLPKYDSTKGTSNYERNEAINRKYIEIIYLQKDVCILRKVIGKILCGFTKIEFCIFISTNNYSL